LYRLCHHHQLSEDVISRACAIFRFATKAFDEDGALNPMALWVDEKLGGQLSENEYEFAVGELLRRFGEKEVDVIENEAKEVRLTYNLRRFQTRVYFEIKFVLMNRASSRPSSSAGAIGRRARCKAETQWCVVCITITITNNAIVTRHYIIARPHRWTTSSSSRTRYDYFSSFEAPHGEFHFH
jgi:hypothetical protein